MTSNSSNSTMLGLLPVGTQIREYFAFIVWQCLYRTINTALHRCVDALLSSLVLYQHFVSVDIYYYLDLLSPSMCAADYLQL